jgi:RNA polymerase sigma factor (sigma-70 family)
MRCTRAAGHDRQHQIKKPGLHSLLHHWPQVLRGQNNFGCDNVKGLNDPAQTFLPQGTKSLSDFRREIVAMLPRLRRLSWVIARSDQDSEDLLHLTIERALERRTQWQPDTRLDLWMFRIMKNLWIDEMRARTRWGKLVERIPDGVDIGDHGAGADDLLDTVELSRVKTLVDGLPDDQRLAIKLILLGKYSYAEAAALLEIPEGTLTSRLARGRAALLQRYKVKETRH